MIPDTTIIPSDTRIDPWPLRSMLLDHAWMQDCPGICRIGVVAWQGDGNLWSFSSCFHNNISFWNHHAVTNAAKRHVFLNSVCMLQKGKETGNMTPSSCNREAGILRTHNVTKMNHSETLRLGQPFVIFSVLPVCSFAIQWRPIHSVPLGIKAIYDAELPPNGILGY